MAFPSGAGASLQSVNRAPLGGTHESLLDLVVTIDPLETFVSSNAPTSKVTDIFHGWTLKSPRSRSSRAAIEGADSTADNTGTSRAYNWTQIMTVKYVLSGTRMAVDATGGDPWARERNEAMRALKNDMEYDIIRGSQISAGSGVAGRLKGMKAFASTLKTNQSGKSLSDTMVNDYLGLAWEQGVRIDHILVGRYQKSRISEFTSGNTKFVPAGDKTIWGVVDVLETDFGRVRVILHRLVTQTGDSGYDFLAYDSNYVNIGVLRAPSINKLAKTGDYESEEITQEVTLEVESEKAIVLAEQHI